MNNDVVSGNVSVNSSPKPGRDGSWGAAARDWADYQEQTMQPLFEAVLDRLEIGPGKVLLDVGCGTGLCCALAIERGAEAEGMDASPTQLAEAEKRVPKAEFTLGEMEELPYEDGEFDLITCCNALQYSMDPLGTLKEMKRVSKPGGTVAILTGARKSGPGGMGVFYSKLGEMRAATSGPSAGQKVIFSDPDAIARFMVEAGLEPYDEKEVECDWVYPDLETAFKGGMSFAPGVRILREYGKDAVLPLVEESLEPYKSEDGGYRIPSMGRYVLGRA